MRLQKSTIRLILIILTIIATLATGLMIARQQSREGKAVITISVAPSDSTVTINDKPAKSGTNYLKPGTYTLTVAYDGFDNTTQAISVKADEKRTLTLMPGATSAAAKKYLTDHPKEQANREQLGGKVFDTASGILAAKYPYLDQLPIETPNFVISKGQVVKTKLQPDDAAIALYVNALTPGDRQRAIERIRSQLGIDPSTVEIIFIDQLDIFSEGG